MSNAYKPPNIKTSPRVYFWRFRIFNFKMTGHGSARITKSLAMFEMALAYQKAVRLMQVPGMV